MFIDQTLTALLPLLTSLLTIANAAPTATTNPPTIVKRWSADDATTPSNVVTWLGDNVDLDGNAVFYSGSNVGKQMAQKFCDENEEDGYKYFWYIFDQQFIDDFGGADPNQDTEVAKSCSIAMGQYATGETRVFNDAGAAPGSFWLTYEKPELMNNADVTHIWSMNDDTTDPNKHDGGDLKASTNTVQGGSFTPGWCTFHVVQYQRNQNGIGADYQFDVQLYDGAHKKIGEVSKKAIDASSKSLSVTSALPWTLEITASGADEDPVRFAYGADSWLSNDGTHQCTLGDGPENGYEDGNREGDCGFTC
ncbi:MAG: hypothetical protein Q9163_000220 [Psora crenata]